MSHFKEVDSIRFYVWRCGKTWGRNSRVKGEGTEQNLPWSACVKIVKYGFTFVRVPSICSIFVPSFGIISVLLPFQVFFILKWPLTSFGGAQLRWPIPHKAFLWVSRILQVPILNPENHVNSYSCATGPSLWILESYSFFFDTVMT